MKQRLVLAAALLGLCVSVNSGAAAKRPKSPRVANAMQQARAVCDSLAGVARGREGVIVRMREDRMLFCGRDGFAPGWTLLVEVADDAGPRGVASARELESWLRARGWAFQDACFLEGPPVRQAAFIRGLLGCSFETSALPRARAVAAGQYAPGYLLTLGVVVR
ncbi:MAG: hypothetical protein ABIU54_07380 [Candidatus Eisenbacteria bacterium]